jgi:hypothetical protein
MKDFHDKNIFELMEVPIDDLQELTIEEFAEEINGKRIDIHPFTEKNHLEVNGNIYISALKANIHIKKDTNGYRISIWGDGYSELYINLSENIIFGLYSYGNDKNYRIAFEGNSPDLLIGIVGGKLNKSSK